VRETLAHWDRQWAQWQENRAFLQKKQAILAKKNPLHWGTPATQNRH
jgi:hypothetical protein